MAVIGVLSDTHVPDRARSLNPRAFEIFRRAQVDAILHAGDVSVQNVLDQLGQIAPVYAVRGNRDWVALRRLPKALRLTFDGAAVALAHGHGRWWNYLRDRVEYILRGYRLEMFLPRLLAEFPDVDVIVFGHTHRPLNQWVDGKLVFNPGSPHFPDPDVPFPSVGLLYLQAGERPSGEIVPL
jgi:putative phosphoesterase